MSYIMLVAAVMVLAGCESSRLPSLLQGQTVPVEPRTSTDRTKDEQPTSAPEAPAVKKQSAASDSFVFEPPSSKTSALPSTSTFATTPPRPVETATAPTSDAAPVTETATAPPAPPTPEQPEAKTPSLIPLLTRQAPTVPMAMPTQEPRPVTPLAPSSTVRVALLVPLSGPNAKLGRSMLNAAQMALFDFSDMSFELLIFDTEGTPEGAMGAASLAIGDGASIMLGPLLAPSVRAVAPMARAANVTVVGFSSDRTITGDGVYTMGFFPETEVERVVAYARSSGIQRFAALAPGNAYGQAVVETLKQTAMMLGAEVSRVQFYDPDSDDFSGVVQEMADYEIRRQALLDQRADLARRDSDLSRRVLERLEKLQTIGDVPYDALLLADGGKRLLAVAALLPFYDIDPKKVRMLGTGQWDAPGLGSEPALLNGWYAGPPPRARAEFVDQYRKTYGALPHRLATLAYDATALAAVMSKSPVLAKFEAEAMAVKSGFWGRDGIFRFAADGGVERGLAVLRLTPDGPKIISKAPESFTD
ncbi:MAG: ABC transporter substrate-binding protein [Rhodospirillaceae bacterium]|nr:ABC transporter substrate-binding protein [Rhodospirillaceae bacterium]MBT5014555.1 ABC transporter substrate-binding protein [Rhodospirillaceae bacterium]MBT5308439.1 ABC transporter substrate-binding protein [Rhodospirillaceae bacterium]